MAILVAAIGLFEPRTIPERADYETLDMATAGINLVFVSGKPG